MRDIAVVLANARTHHPWRCDQQKKPSFRDAPLGAGPESISPVLVASTNSVTAKHHHWGYGFSDAQLRIVARARARPGMTKKAGLRVLATHSARGFQDRSAPKTRGRTRPSREGAGKTGCALHPRSHVQCASKESAHEHTGSAETLRPSLRSGSTAYIVLSLVNRSLLPPSPPERRWPLEDLTPAIRASGPHDFAVRAGTTRQPCRSVHRIPPRVS